MAIGYDIEVYADLWEEEQKALKAINFVEVDTAINKFSTERWIYTNKQDSLADGSWVSYMVGVYDCRDMMSDSVKPIWEKSGECMIRIMAPNVRYDCDSCFVVITRNRYWANRISSNIKNGRFSNLTDLVEALRGLSFMGSVVKANGCENLYINV